MMFSLSVRICFSLVVLFANVVTYAQGTWTAAGSQDFIARYGATSVVIGEKIYVLGGIGDLDEITGSMQVYDVVTGMWSTPTTTGAMTPRGVPAAAVVDGKIYVVGGWDVNTFPLDLVEIFDPATSEWSAPITAGTFIGRYGHTVEVVDGKIYVIGGSHGTMQAFDPASNSWTDVVATGTFTNRVGLSSAMIDGKIYTFGGVSGGTDGNTMQVLDLATLSWSEPLSSGVPEVRRYAATSVLDGKAYLFGGYNGSFLNTQESFDPTTNTWSTITSNGVFTRRFAANAETVGDKIFVFGGSNTDLGGLSTNEVFTLGGSAVSREGANDQMLLSPNPTSGKISGHLPVTSNAVLTITTLAGQELLRSVVSESDITLDLSNFASGSYLVHVRTEDVSLTELVIKE